MHIQLYDHGFKRRRFELTMGVVRSLLLDLEAEENREAWPGILGSGGCLSKHFEEIRSSPNDSRRTQRTDFLFHKACVTDLISFGTLLCIANREHPDCELDKHRLSSKVIESMLADLQNTFDEWHGQVPDERVQDLNREIFDAAPELNLSNSRD